MCGAGPAVAGRRDTAFADLLVARVQPCPDADTVAVLGSSEDDFTRWAMDAAAALAYEYCRNDPDWE
ncbi:hypothetical protein O1L68_43455 [Streptomyces lydicus]|nr:hypothetical protein [Streptomyces lydicus]